MHVGLFAAPERGDEIREAMRVLRKVHVKSSGTTVADNWLVADDGRLSSALETVTHVLLILSGAPIPSWAIFIWGYAHGKGIPVAVAASETVPGVFDGATRVRLSEIDNYMLAERSTWEQAHRVRLARARLSGKEQDANAFYAAALAGDSQALDDYLVAGQSPNARSDAGIPVLIGAVRSQVTECVQKLIAAGADPNASCGTDGTNALCEAASRGLATITGVLLSHNADPNQATQSAQTPLMLAASQGHADVVERLMSAGADPAVRDTLGMDATAYAKLFERTAVLNALGE